MASSKGSRKGKLTLIGLPFETQQTIFSHVNGRDLHSLLRVSKSFYGLASAEIYRDLEFRFTTSEASDHGAMSSRLADALQTIVASEHDYARYIKTFRYGVSEGNSHNALLMARVLWDSAADPCKILNTAMLLMVKQAVMLESFLWDIPIELNRAVYEALHKIQSLRHLRIRLDIPASMKTVVHQTSLPPSHPQHAVPPPPQIPQSFTFPAGSSHSNYSAAKQVNAKTKALTSYDYWNNGRAFSRFKYLTSLTLLGISDLSCLGEISGCLKSSSASLKSLTLSISQELALRSRRPSVPNAAVDEPSESDPDDDEGTLDDPHQPAAITKQHINEADIRREKMAQEAILARIFSLQGVYAEGKKLEKNLALQAKSGVFEDPDLFTQDAKIVLKELVGCFKTVQESNENDRRRAFLEITVKAAERYLNNHPKKVKKPTKEPSKSANHDSKHSPISSASIPPGFDMGDFGFPGSGPPSSSGQWLPMPSLTSNGGKPGAGKLFTPDGMLLSDHYTSPYMLDSTKPSPQLQSLPSVYPLVHGSSSIPSKFTSSSKGPNHASHKKSGLSSMLSPHPPLPLTSTSTDSWNKTHPMVDGANPEGQENIDPFQQMYDIDSEEDSVKTDFIPITEKPALFPATEATGEDQQDSMDIDMEHPDEDTIEMGADQETITETEEILISPRKRAKFEVAASGNSARTTNQSELPKKISAFREGYSLDDVKKSPEEAMQEYIRATHGLQLEELSLYLIPLKGSIVARGLDLNMLKRLTLLNVGSQDPFWLLLVRLQNRSIHVSLESIHTDDVSFAFLDFLKTFEGLTELFMHERSNKQEADQAVVARTGVDITGIRKKALRKHIKSLKRLMIKNENDDAWDLDPKTVALLSVHGGVLRELAISMSMENYHIFMQNVATFKSLIALHLLSLRDNNRSFLHADSLHSAVDSFSHYPEAKLKYIALDNNLRLVSRRPERWSKEFEKRKENRKRIAQIQSKGKGKAKATEAANSEESSEPDLPGDEVGHRLLAMRLRADSRRNFTDVEEEIKIFRKEIRSGKLY